MSSTGSGLTPDFRTYGTPPSIYPALTFVFGCNGSAITYVIVCQILTYSNPVFNIDLCGCTGSGCRSVDNKLNDIFYLVTACRIELYETITHNGINVVQYTSLSELDLTINGELVKSGKYILSKVITVVFGKYICINFDYDDLGFPSIISNLDYTNCAPIKNIADRFSDSSQIQKYMNQANQLLLILPQSPTKMLILDKAYLPLAVRLADRPQTTFLISTGDYNTLSVTKADSLSAQTCTIRYSTLSWSALEHHALYVYTFAAMCNPNVIPSGHLASFSVPGSSLMNATYLFDGYTGKSILQCLAGSPCDETNVVPNPLEYIVDGLVGLVGSVTSIQSVLPSLRTFPNPIGILSSHISIANDFLP